MDRCDAERASVLARKSKVACSAMGEEKKEGFQFPTPPQIFAGGVGGPMVFYTVTPARNALTIASQDINLSIAGCYGQVHAAVFFS